MSLIIFTEKKNLKPEKEHTLNASITLSPRGLLLL